MNIATVVEGPSDHEVIQTIINYLLPGRHHYFPLQPTGTMNEKGELIYGETGAGWKGVRRWCQETWQRPASSIEAILESVSNAPLDLLILQVDADIVENGDLQEESNTPIVPVDLPCPPIQGTVENLRQVLLNWLSRQALPPQVILMIPARDTESWTFAALYPNDRLCLQPDYECLKPHQLQEHPGYLLTQARYGKRLKYKDGAVKKSRSAYAQLLPSLSNEWDNVCRICSQAQNFSQEVTQKAG